MTGRAAIEHVNWGIIGPGAIARNFAQGLKECDFGSLAAVASRNTARAQAFTADFPAQIFDSYDAMLASDTIDAVYVATPHPFHFDQASLVLNAGKHVLVEKPAALSTAGVRELTELADAKDRFFLEGLMYRCHPQISGVVSALIRGDIGKVTHIDASFGFAAPFDAKDRLFDKDMGGGAILDVGAYPVSMVRLVAGIALGKRIAEPVQVAGLGTMAASGVDDAAYLHLKFDDNITATCGVAITREMSNDVTIHGTKGTIHIPDPWVPGRNAGPSDAQITITVDDRAKVETYADPRILFAHEAHLASIAIIGGLTEAPYPAMGWDDSIGNMAVLETWLAQVG